jgi:two-component system chemotaxis response regulator CheB
MSKVRVLVVDDSATMRGLISAALRRDPEIEVVGTAGDPFEAREAIKALNPDVITLDIEMPNMNGLDFLEKIMRLRPMPVVMVSTLTLAGAEATLQALEFGAVDCIAKPANLANSSEVFAEMTLRVKTAARSVLTQHMPATFTKSFAARLDRASGAKVEEAYDGAPLDPGHVYLAPGGSSHLEVVRSGGHLRCRLREGDPVSGHRPSVDVLFKSVADATGAAALGVILTGMGRDGAQGLLAMRKAGAHTLGQDETTCVVYGMPRAAQEIGAVERQLPLSALGEAILDQCSNLH